MRRVISSSNWTRPLASSSEIKTLYLRTTCPTVLIIAGCVGIY